MGYSYSSINKLVSEKDFFRGKKILTLGTLYPYFSNSQRKKLIRRGINVDVKKEDFSKYLFVKLLEAESCQSLDVSDYQGSEIICNLNDPIPDNFKGQYDIVIDAGTLEHLSNFSIAFRNLLDLLREDGIYYFAVPANNWIDHGFFQISPTFFIDLAIDNSNIELIDLNLSTSTHIYKYTELNPLMRLALYSSGYRLNVGGKLKKLSGGVNLDLVQTKYRKQYLKDKDSKKKKSIFKNFLINKSINFASNRYIPYGIKKIVIFVIYKLKSL